MLKILELALVNLETCLNGIYSMDKYFYYKVWLDHGVADELIATFVDEKILNKCKPSLNRYAKSLDCKLKIQEYKQT
jgi:hypothetical protein